MADPSSAALPEPGADDVVYVLDASGYVFRAYHALPPLSSSKGEVTHAVHGFTAMLQKLLDQRRPVLMAVALDSKRPSFRKEVFPKYKANRPPAPPDLAQQMVRCHEIVEAYRLPSFAIEGMEADDIIATLVRRCREARLRVVIVSADKDLLQLVGDGVVMYDSMRERVFGPAETEEKMGVRPERVRDLLALTGDSSDNIPGVPSVGPKTARALLEKFGDLEGVLAHVDDVERAGLRQKLSDHREDALLSFRLVTLREDLEIDADAASLRWPGGDVPRLRALFAELELKRLLEQLPSGDDTAAASKSPAPAPKPIRTILDEHDLRECVDTIAAAGQLSLFTALDGDDPLAGELVGVGLCCVPDRAWYLPIGHRTLGAPTQLGVEPALELLRPLLEDPALAKQSPDIKRDEVALGRHGVRLAGGAFDTTLASYLLDAGRHAHGIEDMARIELGIEVIGYDAATDKQRGSQKALHEVDVERGAAYAAERARTALDLASRLGPRIDAGGFGELLRDVELPLAHVLAVMEGVGIRLDVEHLRRLSRDATAEMARLESRCHELAGREFNVASPRQLETILFDELGLPVVKKTKTARSTDHEVLEELAPMHPLPDAIVEHRVLAKLKSTYLDALPRQVNASTGRVHTRYNQAVAATGRISSSDPNLQNIPIRTDLGRSIRHAFVPEEGWDMLSADYSQIELRVLAHLSRDSELCEAYAKGEDVHVRTATALFDVSAADVTREQRGRAKTVNFAVIYGQTQFALARNLRIDRKEAQRYIDAFFQRYAGVARFLDEVVEQARATGEVRTLLGRRRAMPDLSSRNHNLRSAAERVARNSPIQGSAADIMKVAMVRIQRDMEERELRSRMLLTVHDELVFEAPPAERDVLVELVRARMEGAADLSVPLVVDHGWGRTWGEAH